MKYRISSKNPFLFAILLALLLVSSPLAAQWKEITNLPFGFRNNLWLDVMFLKNNTNYGWVVGMGGRVLRTTNGGQTWQGSQVPAMGPVGHLEHVQFLNTQIGYCSGPSDARIYKSFDGGATWLNVTPITMNPFASIWGFYFLNEDEGVLLATIGCETQLFYKTVNGGMSWTLFTRNDPNIKLSDALLYPDGTGYAAGSGVIYRTLDRGVTWDMFSVTGTTTWHEEIARSGTSFLVPNAGTQCSGGGNFGGMRFSIDNGATWRQSHLTPPMFGSYLIDGRTGWTAGKQRSVYYTDDGGLTWQLRNCGIRQGHDLDDIWFNSPDDGWVVGDGVYRYAGDEPPNMYPLSLNTGNRCINDTFRVNVALVNLLNREEMVEFSFANATQNAFSIAGGNRVFVPCKDSVLVEVLFHPREVRNYNEQITAFFTEAGESFQMQIAGAGTGGYTAIEEDTFEFPPIRINSEEETELVATWQPAVPGVSYRIMEIQRVSGSPAIVPPTVPLNVDNSRAVPLRFVANPQDTGMHEAQFRVRLSDCLNDTIITLRFLAISPMLSVPDRPLLVLRDCVSEGIDSIPVRNTGNDTLRIFGATFSDDADGSFSLQGWSGGRDTPPISIAPGDSVYVRYRFRYELPGVAEGTIALTHNDGREGVPNPYPLRLRARRNFPLMTLPAPEIDFGVLCVGEEVELPVSVGNNGNAPLRLSGITGGGEQFVFVGASGGSIVPQGTGEVRIAFSPAETGIFEREMLIEGTPCDQRRTLIVRGEAISSALESTPTVIDAGVIPVGGSRELTLDLRNVGNRENIPFQATFVPPLPPGIDIQIDRAIAGNTIDAGNQLSRQLLINAEGEANYSGELVITYQVACRGELRIPVNVAAIPSNLSFSTLEINEFRSCTEPIFTFDIDLRNEGVLPIDILSVTLEQEDADFEMEAPAFPLQIAGDEELTLQIRKSRMTEGIFTATLVVESTEGAQPIRRIPVVLEVLRPLSVASVEEIDFGNTEVCRVEEVRTFTLSNTGSFPDTVLLTTNSANFSVEGEQIVFLEPGQETQYRVLIRPSELGSGVFNGEITFQSTVCGSPLRLPVEVNVFPASIVVEPQRLDFGTLQRGEVSERSITIRNIGREERLVRFVEQSARGRNFVLPVELEEGIVLAPQEERQFAVSSIGLDAGEAEELFLTDDGYCVNLQPLQLLAAVPDVAFRITLEYQNYTAGPEEVLSIPLIVEGPLAAVSPRKVFVKTTFEREMLLPERVYDKREIALNPVYFSGGFEIEIPEEIFSNIILQQGRKDTLFLFDVKAHLAPMLTSLLRIEEVEILSDERVDITTIDGSVTMPETCWAERLPLRFIPTTRMRRIQGFEGIVEVQFEATERLEIGLVVRDLFGRECGRKTAHVAKGEHVIGVPVGTLAQGVYFVEISDPAKTILQKIIIQR